MQSAERLTEAAVRVISALLCAIVVVGLWLRGIPAFQHDWSWPFTRSQGFSEAFYALHIFRPLGLGTAANAANGAPVTILMFGATALVGPLTALHVFDLLFVAVSALGTFLFARSYDAKCSGSIAAAVFCSSPVIYNKVFAGHTYYLFGAALLPWIAYFAIEAVKRNRFVVTLVVACGITLGLAASQFQFILIGTLLLALVVATQPSTFARKAQVVIGAVVVALALHVADYSVMLQPQTGAALASQVATPQWEISQSEPLTKALAQYDYIGGYARLALGTFADTGAEIVTTLILICAGIAAFALGRKAALALVLIAVGWFISAGTYGPFAVPLLQLFEHNGVATAFRELYNFEIMTALGCALVVAQVVALGRSTARIAMAILTCTLAVLLAMPFLAAPPATTMVATTEEHAVEMASQTRNARGRVLLLPGGPALSYVKTAFHGVDSDGQPWDSASPVTYTSSPDQYAYLFSGEATPQLLARLGIVKVINRRDVRDAYFDYLDPHSRTIARSLLVRNSGRPSLEHSLRGTVDDDFTGVLITRRVVAGDPLWGTVNALPLGEHLVSDAPDAIVPTAATVRVGVDPVTDWTQSTRWLPAIPQLSCLPQPSLFRLRGATVTSRCNWHNGQFAGKRCLTDSATALEALSLSCVYKLAPGNSRTPAASLTTDIAHGTASVAYMRTAFDGRWSLFCNGKPVASTPVVVDAYAMGWVIRTPCNRSFTATFAGDTQFRDTLFVSWIAIALLLIAESFTKGLRFLRDR